MPDLKNRIRQALRRSKGVALSHRELVRSIKLSRRETNEFKDTLDEMASTGEIVYRRGRIQLGTEAPAITGQVVKVNRTYGFVRLDQSGEDVMVPGRKLRGAMPGDKVSLRVQKSRRGGDLIEGEVLSIIEAAPFRFTGVVMKDRRGAEVLPDKDVRFALTLDRKDASRVRDGEKVLAELSHRGQSHFDHVVRIVSRYGSSDSAKSCCEAILDAAGIRREFPSEAEAEAEEINAAGIHPKERAVREDLRDLPIFTIDSADSKDLDDAVSLERRGDGWLLGVHIADVSYYVKAGSPLDEEALERGTSVYFADSVIPMLPRALSNGICSLNPGEDRLTFSAFVSIDKNGAMTDYSFRKTMIRSRVKGVYSEINAILDGTADGEILKKYDGLIDTIREMETLARLLLARRSARGGLDLESVESRITLDENGVACDIQPRTRGFSEQIIEEFMLMANQAAATFAMKEELPFLFRVHEEPKAEKIESLRETLLAVGVNTAPLRNGTSPMALYEILQSVKGKPEQMLVNNCILRSMAKAKYSEENIGHFGLVLENYAHFTSPIRRYPDLAIHRIMSSLLIGMRRDNIEKRFREFSHTAAFQSSDREVRAMTVERDCEDSYKAEYMREHLGEVFEGTITSVVNFGFYVTLPNTVEGLVHVSTLPQGEFEFDGHASMRDRWSGRAFRVGDRVEVQVAAADVSAGNIDFQLLETLEDEDIPGEEQH